MTETTVERGMVVRYHGSLEAEHCFEFVVTGPDPRAEGRYRLGNREYPEFPLWQVRRESFTPTGETVELCRCDHEFSWAGHGRPDQPEWCGAYGCGCRAHIPGSVAQIAEADATAIPDRQEVR